MDDNKRKLENESESDDDCIGPLPAEAVPTKKTKSNYEPIILLIFRD